MRDEILKLFRKWKPTAYYHVIAWALFIAYEISLAGAIRGSYHHISDYLFHYPVYIILFYVHCYLVLRSNSSRSIATYGKLIFYTCLEFACYYGCNVLINDYLKSSGWPVEVIDPFTPRFNLGTLYRFIYIVGLSTAYRITLNLLDSQKRNYEFLTDKLVREKENEQLRAQKANAELSLLRSKVTPHFLYNTLNSIYNLFLKKDPNNAEYIMAFAQLMRYAFKPEIEADEVALESEIEHISNYLKVQKMRYSSEVDLIVNVDEPELQIAPLLLFNLVENIFSHGDLKKRGFQPVIEISSADGVLEFRTKNYIRRDPNPGNGIGLANVRERLDHQYKDRFEFDFRATSKIFYVKLRIKLR